MLPGREFRLDYQPPPEYSRLYCSKLGHEAVGGSERQWEAVRQNRNYNYPKTDITIHSYRTDTVVE